MGNNKEIRQTMETYRSVLLVLNWFVAIGIVIFGIIMAIISNTPGIGYGALFVGMVIGAIGHFLINVILAIPFILLNNGEFLATIADNNKTACQVEDDVEIDNKWRCGKCGNFNDIYLDHCEKCGKKFRDNMFDGFIPTHKVKLLTNAEGLGLRKEPNPSTDIFKRIPNGTGVRHLGTGGSIKLNDKEGLWFEIRTEDSIQGWCFSGSLEKI